jgi:NodT family efflux transporter outer membrane factor (OMF) lipoprotein
LGVLLLGGCTVGPDYHGPPVLVADTRPFARAAVVSVNAAPGLAQWWTVLNDPELDRLETAALANSPDIAVAMARVRESRATLRAREADLRPSSSASAIYLRAHTGTGFLSNLTGGSSSAAAQSGAAGESGVAAEQGSSSSDFNFYDVGFDASWEIDLFGGKRRAAEAAAADAGARVADLADAQVTLTAEVARSYVSLRDLQHRTALEQASARLQQQMLALGQQRATAGTISDLDVERLRGQVQQTLADLVPLQAQIDAQRNELAVLTGRLPGDVDAELAAAIPVPLPPATVSIGDPAAMIRRRPDIRAAERQIASSNATVGQHVADYFPKLQLLGDIGFSSDDIGRLFTGPSFSALALPVLSWKPFDFGRTEAAVDEARAGRDEAVANYRSTVLKALQDAETSLSDYGYQRRNLAGLQQVYDSANRAAGLARQRYQAGTIALTDVLDTERQRYQAEEALAQGEGEMTADYVALQKSLGLGWQEPELTRTATASR